MTIEDIVKFIISDLKSEPEEFIERWKSEGGF